MTLAVVLAGWVCEPVDGQPLITPADTLPAVNVLRTPVSPAFALLGVEPISVERPSTPAGFALSILSRTDNLSALPENYAVEVAPYWLVSHPELTWQRDGVRSVGESIVRTFSISLATADMGLATPASTTGLAVGARAALLSGRLSRESRARLDALARNLADFGRQIHALSRARTSELERQLLQELSEAQSEGEREGIRRKFEALLAAAERDLLDDPAYVAARAAIEEFEVERVGWFLDAAGGAVFAFPGQVWDDGDLNRWGVWMTASYRAGTFSPVVLVRRYIETDAPDLWDVGGRLIYSARDFSLSAESVLRVFTGDGAPDNQYRVVGTAEYRISPLGWLVASFGRGHDTVSSGNLIARLGLTLNWSRR